MDRESCCGMCTECQRHCDDISGLSDPELQALKLENAEWKKIALTGVTTIQTLSTRSELLERNLWNAKALIETLCDQLKQYPDTFPDLVSIRAALNPAPGKAGA